MNSVKEQYEKFPYPPLSTFLLPKKSQGESLQYELGATLAFGSETSHRGKRILVCGSGTFETLVVAQMHPHAEEIVAVDISENSIKIFNRRLSFARFQEKIFMRFGVEPLPKIKTICADLRTFECGSFDYIIASNVLHHVEDPPALLKRLSGFLNQDGIFRLVTYPKASRLWMRETSRWLKSQGLSARTKGLRAKAGQCIKTLPLNHPVRTSFESHPEISTETGIIDAFFHSCENPLSPLEWAEACEDSGLEWVGEGQCETSQSSFLTEIIPETAPLHPWVKLQILDDLLELCVNPILWLKKSESKADLCLNSLPTFFQKPALIKSTDVQFEIGRGLRRVEFLLRSVPGVTLFKVLQKFREQVGPRVLERRFLGPKILHGLSISELKEEDIQKFIYLELPEVDGLVDEAGAAAGAGVEGAEGAEAGC